MQDHSSGVRLHDFDKPVGRVRRADGIERPAVGGSAKVSEHWPSSVLLPLML
jgi:hypothetical protein